MFAPAATAKRIASDARVVERAVADVLDEVLGVGEVLHADELRALAAHLRDAGDRRPCPRARAGPSCGSRCRRRAACRPGWRSTCCAGSPSRTSACAPASARARRVVCDARARSPRPARRPSQGVHAAPAARAKRHRDRVGVEVGLQCDSSGASELVALADDPRRVGACRRARRAARSPGTGASPRPPAPRRGPRRTPGTRRGRAGRASRPSSAGRPRAPARAGRARGRPAPARSS